MKVKSFILICSIIFTSCSIVSPKKMLVPIVKNKKYNFNDTGKTSYFYINLLTPRQQHNLSLKMSF